MTHIHQPAHWLGRTVGHCPTCKRRRRFVVRIYEYYASRFVCGGCGNTFTSDDGCHRVSKGERRMRRQWVKDTWPNVARLSDVVRRMISEIENDLDTPPDIG